MKRFRLALYFRFAATLLMIAWSAAAGAAQSTQPPPSPHSKAHAVSLQELERQIAALQHEVQTLKAHEDSSWRSRQEQTQIKRIVQGVLKDSARHEQALQQQTTAGYDHGFFIRSPDNKFRLNIRGYIQAGYTFAYSSVGNAQNISTTGQPLGPPTVGDASRFTLRRARLIFSGHAWSPRVVYEVSGDFAGSSNNNGYFNMKTTYAGYRFSQGALLRAGTLRVPFTYLSDYPVTGDDFGSFPLLFTPFNADRSLGLDLSGKLFSDHLTYDAQINNGSKASNVGNAIDNRFGYYMRVQWSHGGRVRRFQHEAAMHTRNHVAWMLGLGAGYESQNSTADAFPSPQTSLTMVGLSTPDGAGFYPSFPANGSLYRATADAHIKFNGMDASVTAFFQQYNDRPPAGSSTDDFATAFGRQSLYEIAYYGELGYFLVPRKWQMIGRAGELFTQGGNKQMVEFGLGLNRYIYGRNVRVQTAVIYIPNAAALSSSSTNVVLNAQNLISQVQVQIRF
ncbi:MAG: hypothetical protein HKL96_12360 [Phycisphaerales bacterium]|nr:hypothetical protein [Phycisphaerales bacterium]